MSSWRLSVQPGARLHTPMRCAAVNTLRPSYAIGSRLPQFGPPRVSHVHWAQAPMVPVTSRTAFVGGRSGDSASSCLRRSLRHTSITRATVSGGSSDDADDDEKSSSLDRLLALLRTPSQLPSAVAGLFQRIGGTWLQWAVRAAVFVAALMMMALGRESMAHRARIAPREVLYSDFVTLLDRGGVQSAWLESGTSRLHFNLATAVVVASPAVAVDQAKTSEAAVPAAASALKKRGAAREAAIAAAAEKAAAAVAAAATTAAATAAATELAPAATAAAAAAAAGQRRMFITLPSSVDATLTQRILTAGVPFGVVQTSFQTAMGRSLLSVLALWVPLLPLMFVVKRILDARMGGTKKAKTGAQTPNVSFRDVAGVDGAKRELQEVVALLRAERLRVKGPDTNLAPGSSSILTRPTSKLLVKIPSGVLLCGPPGTGKTLLAKAVAGEAGVPFLSVSASEFVELFVGRGAARVRELFTEARQVAPCVVFIDELDAVGSKRGMGFNDERDQTLNQLLTELDGFDARPGVLFLAATNRADVLDPALLRPGRIARRVVVPLPDVAGRRDILAVHLRDVPLTIAAQPVSLLCERLAQATPGFSGAELANVVNEGLLLSSRAGSEEVGMVELLQGVQRTRFGVDGRDGSNGGNGNLGSRFNSWLLNMAAGREDKSTGGGGQPPFVKMRSG